MLQLMPNCMSPALRKTGRNLGHNALAQRLPDENLAKRLLIPTLADEHGLYTAKVQEVDALILETCIPTMPQVPHQQIAWTQSQPGCHIVHGPSQLQSWFDLQLLPLHFAE